MKDLTRNVLGGIALGTVFCAAAPALAQSPQEAALTSLVERFTHAQQQFDVATLKNLTADSYVEVSPVGDVDPRDKMLGFYAPEHKQNMPEITISEVEVHPFSHSAVVLAKISYTFSGPDGKPHDLAMRASFVADETTAGWKLLSAQYTGIRPQKQQQ